MSISGMTTGGQTFPFDQFLQAQKRGMRYRPFGGVLEGLVVSAPASFAVDAASVAVTVSAGKAKLDAQDVSLGTGGSATVSLANYDFVNGLNPISVFLTPTRLVPTVTSVPTGGSDYDRRVLVVDGPDGQVMTDLYENVDGVWKVIHPWHGAINPGNPMSTYTRGAIEAGSGNLSMPLNDIAPALALNANFTGRPEKYVYYPTQVPVQFSQPQKAILRQSASFLLAQLFIDLLVLPIVVQAEADDSTLVGDFSPLLKAGATATNVGTRFRVNGLGLTNEGITAIAPDGQTITVGTATPTGTGPVTVIGHASAPVMAHYMSVITGANSLRNFNDDATILI